MRPLAVLLCALLLPSCTLANLTPSARFSEASFSLNDASRWGRVDIAVSQVSSKYKQLFMTRHQEWGGAISIADSEVVQMVLAEDKKSALSEVAVNWYRSDGVTLHTSFISQKWEVEQGHFLLVDEKVRSGDSAVFVEAPSDPS